MKKRVYRERYYPQKTEDIEELEIVEEEVQDNPEELIEETPVADMQEVFDIEIDADESDLLSEDGEKENEPEMDKGKNFFSRLRDRILGRDE